MKKLFGQIVKFGAVGFLCFFIDYFIMVALTELVGIPSFISSACSYTISTVVNYILSITVVFDADKNANKTAQFVKKTRYTLPGALLATVAGIAVSVWLAGKMAFNS